METPVEIPLCEYQSGLGRRRPYAQLDELTLTYRVFIGHPDGRAVVLREYVPSRRQARRWATQYRSNAASNQSPRDGLRA
jgi:hypothetical protein